MPKNKTGGKKFRGKKKASKDTNSSSSRPLELKAESQEYARVTKLYGNRRVQAVNNEGTECLCIIPGKFKSRVWINVGDIILLGIRQFQSDKCDVIYKYTSQEAKKLYKLKEITSFLFETKTDNTIPDNDNLSGDDVFYFDNSDSDSDSDDDDESHAVKIDDL